MVYKYIKSVLDSLGHKNAQDTPLGELTDSANKLFVYTGGDLKNSGFTMGCPVIDNVQKFYIYGVTSDLYIENTLDNTMGRELLHIFNELRKGLPYQGYDTNGTHYITDITDPQIKYLGTDSKTLRVTEMEITVLWSYKYGGN